MAKQIPVNIAEKLADPNAENFTFGMEFETTIPSSTGITARGWSNHGQRQFASCEGATMPDGSFLPCPTYMGANGQVGGFQPTMDGTITYGRDHRGIEFVSPIMQGQGGLTYVTLFLEWLRKIGAKVNHSTGLHIHVGVESVLGGQASIGDTMAFLSGLTALSTVSQWGVYSQTGSLRHLTYWAKPIDQETKDAIKVGSRMAKGAQMSIGALRTHIVGNSTRCQMLNLQNLGTTGTVEFRAFAGTTNTDKVLHHLATCLGLCSLAKESKRTTWMERDLAKTTGKKELVWLWKRLGWKRDNAWSKMRTAQGRDYAYGLFGTLYLDGPTHCAKALEMATKWDAKRAEMTDTQAYNEESAVYTSLHR